MSDVAQLGLQGLRLLIGPSHDGLWIVSDAAGLCGAVFACRDDATNYAKRECMAAQPRSSEWRLVASLDLPALFARSSKAA